MKRIGILFVSLLLSGVMAMAQSSSTTSTSANGTDTNTPDTTKQMHRDAAAADENAAQNAKDRAKNATTDVAHDRDKAIARLDDGGKIVHQLLTAPDNGIPEEVLDEREMRCGNSLHA